MDIVRSPDDLQQLLTGWKENGLSIGFVPTMGALHRGHLSLVDAAKSGTDRVVVSIFVNPTQFNNPDDLTHYPRKEEQDLSLLDSVGCHAVFLPSVSAMYPGGPISDRYEIGFLETTMEGSFRPGHFQGVATVVERLFQLVRPDRAYFGEKDYQQLAVIRHLNQSLGWGVEVIGCENIRESDGLAMSSRNLRLSSAERQQAPGIYAALTAARALVGSIPPRQLAEQIKHELECVPGFEPEYVEIADEDTLRPLNNWSQSKRPRIFTAVQLGNIRLIDNLSLI